MKGFAGGRLFDEKRSPFGVAMTPVQCIHYALTRPTVGSILCGYDSTEQLDQAVAYETATDEEKDYASVIANAPQHSYRGQCTYCGHCKPCVMNLDIAMINKFYDLATMQPQVPATIGCWSIRLQSASAARPAKPDVPSACPLPSGWSKRQSCSAADSRSIELRLPAGSLQRCRTPTGIFQIVACTTDRTLRHSSEFDIMEPSTGWKELRYE